MLACASHLVGGFKFICNPYFTPYIIGGIPHIYIYIVIYITIYIYSYIYIYIWGITDLLSRAPTPPSGVNVGKKSSSRSGHKIV